MGVPEAVGDLIGVVKPHQAAYAPRPTRADVAGGVTVADRVVVVPYQPADIIVAVYSTGGIAVSDFKVVESNQSTHVRESSHLAGGIGDADCAVFVVPNQSACVVGPSPVYGVDSVHVARGVAPADCASFGVHPHQPAYVRGIVPNRYAAGCVDVVKGADVSPDQPTD